MILSIESKPKRAHCESLQLRMGHQRLFKTLIAVHAISHSPPMKLDRRDLDSGRSRTRSLIAGTGRVPSLKYPIGIVRRPLLKQHIGRYDDDSRNFHVAAQQREEGDRDLSALRSGEIRP